MDELNDNIKISNDHLSFHIKARNDFYNKLSDVPLVIRILPPLSIDARIWAATRVHRLTPNPAICPFLAEQMPGMEVESLTSKYRSIDDEWES